ncbi:MAG: VRR-NUC domain-containing protein [Candidatus Aenigmatarchaeota archaeon]
MTGNNSGNEFDELDDRITDTEKVARDIIEANWDNVLRTTPRAIHEFEEEYPKACEIVSRKASESNVELGNAFRPGVPDFLAFNDDGEYRFIEVKGEGDGLRHSQLKWLRDFKGLNAEIWFTDSNDGITEKMDADNLEAYSLKKPDSAGNGNAEVEASSKSGFLNVQIPETLAAVMNLEEGDRVSWSIIDRSKLELDTD